VQVERFLKRWPFDRPSRIHIVVLEEFDRSMAMLSRMMGLTLRDALYIKVNVFKAGLPADRRQNKLSSAKHQTVFPSETVDLDFMLYSSLNQSFVKRTSTGFGPDCDREARAIQRCSAVLEEAYSQQDAWKILGDPELSSFLEDLFWPEPRRLTDIFKFYCSENR